MKTSLWKTIGFMLITLVTMTGCDLATKSWARENLSQARAHSNAVCDAREPMDQRIALPPKEIVHNVFELRYAENCGAAWSLFSTAPKPARTIFFVGVNLAAMAVLGSLLRPAKRPTKRVFVGAGLAASGALGNLIDRLTHGYVTDFLHVHAARSWSYPVFNVADILVGVGIGFIILDAWLSPNDPSTATQATT